MPKTKCEYCGGVTHDDELGNCLACGAPRKETNVWLAVKRDIEMHPVISTYQYAIGFGGVCSTGGVEWCELVST